jgi:rubrerythrin
MEELQAMKTCNKFLTYLLVLLVVLPLLLVVGCQKKDEAQETQQLVTYENLQIAYGVAMKRALWYNRFAKQAEKEGLSNVAVLFHAVSLSEQIHADNHAKLLKSKGIEPRVLQIDSVAPGKARQYLKMSVGNETVQIEATYPPMILTAEAEKFTEAMEQFKTSLEGDKRHYELLKWAADRGGDVPRARLFLCRECGYIVTSEKTEECPACHAKKDKFEKL